jgi:hypothetical protein
MSDRNGEMLRRWALVGVLLLATALRLYRLGAGSLWYDETVSVHLASKSMPALLAHTAGDIHPPGYYLLLHGWTHLAGSGDFAVAFPSLFFGLLLVALAYRIAARVFGPVAGLLAALLVALSPYNLWYSQEVRMYTLGAALGMGLLDALLSGLGIGCTPRRRAGRRWNRSWLAVYAALGALGLWNLYYFAFLLVTANLMVGLWWLGCWRKGRASWAWMGRWALAQGAVLLLYAPWIPVAWRQATQPPVPPWRGFSTAGEVAVEVWSALSLGQSVEPHRVWPVLILTAILFALGLFSVRLARRNNTGVDHAGLWVVHREPGPWLLAGYTFVPVLLIYVASFATPLYHVRYAFTYSTPFYVLLGAGLAWLWRDWRGRSYGSRRAWQAVLGASLAVILVFSGVSIYAYHSDPEYASDDHRSAARFLSERWRPGDAILVNAGYAYTALVTYWDADPIAWRGRLVTGDSAPTVDWATSERRRPVVVLTGSVDGEPSLGWGDPASDFYAMSWVQTGEALEALFATFDRVWVYRIYDTVTDPEAAIRRWLDEHGTRFEDQVFSGQSQLRVQGFLTGREVTAGESNPIQETLVDGSLRLEAVEQWAPAVAVGEALDLVLEWRRTGQLVEDGRMLFASLYDKVGERWAQVDEKPLGTLWPVAHWPEAAVRTPLRIWVPAGTPPGDYWLEVGWYRFVDGQPVWLPWADGDRLVLGAVEVIAPEDWGALPVPVMEHPLEVTVGDGVRLLGFNAQALEAYPGDRLQLEVYWQAMQSGPEPGPAVLQLSDNGGTVVAEATSAPVGGRAAFAGLEVGQVIRDPRDLRVPGELAPGIYVLALGRTKPDGGWLAVRRGPVTLGTTMPLATVRVLGRSMDRTPPVVQHAADARLGAGVRLAGYDLDLGGPSLHLALHWQVLDEMVVGYKIFAHLVEMGGGVPRAQADVYPHLPTTGWMPGEYLRDDLMIDLPPDLAPGRYELLVGLYHEATGSRLAVTNAQGQVVGDAVRLGEIQVE